MGKAIVEEIEKLADGIQKEVPDWLASKLASECQGFVGSDAIARQILKEHDRLDLWSLVEKIYELSNCLSIKHYLKNLHKVVPAKTS